MCGKDVLVGIIWDQDKLNLLDLHTIVFFSYFVPTKFEKKAV